MPLAVRWSNEPAAPRYIVYALLHHRILSQLSTHRVYGYAVCARDQGGGLTFRESVESGG